MALCFVSLGIYAEVGGSATIVSQPDSSGFGIGRQSVMWPSFGAGLLTPPITATEGLTQRYTRMLWTGCN
jgi:hypothetical protein